MFSNSISSHRSQLHAFYGQIVLTFLRIICPIHIVHNTIRAYGGHFEFQNTAFIACMTLEIKYSVRNHVCRQYFSHRSHLHACHGQTVLTLLLLFVPIHIVYNTGRGHDGHFECQNTAFVS